MASWGKGQFLAISLLLAVVFGSCSGKTEIPEDVLPPSKMTSLMIKVHLIEAKVGRLGLSSDSSKTLFNHFESLLLEEHGLDTASYNRSLRFYTSEPKVFKKVYLAVVDSLMEMENQQQLIDEEQERLEKEKEEKRREEKNARKEKIDSLRKAPKPSFVPLMDSIDSKKIRKFELNQR